MQETFDSLPMNLSLLILNAQNLSGVKPITVLDIMEGASKTFHPEGLFSVEIFGKVGDERRNRLYGYIDLGIEIFHPTIFQSIVRLKELYKQVMAGSAYAKWDVKAKDFVPATLKDGETGYTFFMKHFDELKFEHRPSTSREFAIKLVEGERGNLLMDKLLVMPAGLRDYVITPNGKPEEDEINTLYRRVMSIASVLKGQKGTGDTAHLDSSRYGLQNAVNEIYQYILNLWSGKNKLAQGHWTARNIFYSSRNVITATVPRSAVLGDQRAITMNHTVVGLYQFMMSVFPIMAFHIREYAQKVFFSSSGHARLVDKKTLESVTAIVSAKQYDSWMTQEGLEATFARFEPDTLRHLKVEVEGYYFGLIYDDGMEVRFCQGKNELPEGRDPKHLRPISYAELYYLAIFQRAREIPGFVTRYPVIEMGSVYPSWTYLKTTTKSRVVSVLDEAWQPLSSAGEWPVDGEPFFNSMSPAFAHLGPLGADFDGDTMSYTPVMTDEGIADVRRLLNSKEYYKSLGGGLIFTASNNISDLVTAELTA